MAKMSKRQIVDAFTAMLDDKKTSKNKKKRAKKAPKKAKKRVESSDSESDPEHMNVEVTQEELDEANDVFGSPNPDPMSDSE